MTARPWLTQKEVANLLGVSLPQVTKMRQSGKFVGTIDGENHWQYDRESVERYAHESAALRGETEEMRESLRREAEHARDRARRERRLEREAEEERQERRDGVFERIATALEKLVKRPC